MGLPQCFHSTCPEEQFWKKTSKNNVFLLSFLEVEQTISACCRNFFSCCRNCILGVPRNMSGKKFLFSKIKNSYLFRTISAHFPAFIQDIFVTISKIAFHLSIGTIWGKQIRKNIWFSLHFWTISWKKVARRQTFWASIVKTAIYPSKGKKCFSR